MSGPHTSQRCGLFRKRGHPQERWKVTLLGSGSSSRPREERVRSRVCFSAKRMIQSIVARAGPQKGRIFSILTAGEMSRPNPYPPTLNSTHPKGGSSQTPVTLPDILCLALGVGNATEKAPRGPALRSGRWRGGR